MPATKSSWDRTRVVVLLQANSMGSFHFHNDVQLGLGPVWDCFPFAAFAEEKLDERLVGKRSFEASALCAFAPHSDRKYIKIKIDTRDRIGTAARLTASAVYLGSPPTLGCLLRLACWVDTPWPPGTTGSGHIATINVVH
ncbi:hypothetical protein ACLOJK_032425 [Asimina triloba]